MSFYPNRDDNGNCITCGTSQLKFDGFGPGCACSIVADAEVAEQERIKSNIMSRVVDLQTCSKNDNCAEFAMLIESYIDEWMETE